MATFRKNPQKTYRKNPFPVDIAPKKSPLSIEKVKSEIDKFLVEGKQYLFDKYGISSVDTSNAEFIVQYHKNVDAYSKDKEFIDTYAMINISNDKDNDVIKRISYTSVLELRKKYLN